MSEPDSCGEWVPVEELRAGDLVDLEGDLFADPYRANVQFEYEYVHVGDMFGESPGELESGDTYRLDYEGGACGFPVGHLVRRVGHSDSGGE